jgi:hypothetical protein
MRIWRIGLGLVFAAAAVGGGCSASGTLPPGGAGGTGTVTSGVGGTGILTSTGGTGGTGGINACATFHAAGKQDPAAMLIVLDRSASMSTVNKWPTAQTAVVQAIDADVFDTMSLGLTAFPAGPTAAPACLLGLFPQVYCGSYKSDKIPIPLAPAASDKSSAATGVRHDISNWLFSQMPEISDGSDSSPIYDALSEAYTALKGYNIEKRIAVLITDGGFGCTSVASPSRPGISDGLCPDWEYPSTVNTLIASARVNPSAPINTFVVGVPGSNSHGEQQGPYATAPYSMLLALSTYAVSGSPDTVDPTCDKSAVFAVGGADPAHPCHINLASGTSFNPTALADAIAVVRGKALGCNFGLPDPPAGESIDKNKVNVVVTVNGQQTVIPRRKDPSDTCASSPCWDYDAQGKVQLVGAGCTTAGQPGVQVDIYVGCATIVN